MSEIATQDALTLRAIEPGDAAACSALSLAVSWPHRIEDWELVLGLGHGIVARLGEQVVGSALWWPYGEDYATLGMIIVAPEHQGVGIGKLLMQGLFEQANGRALALNATAEGQPLYAKTGFVPCGEVHQYQGKAPPTPAPMLAAGEQIRQASLADLPLVKRLDREATGLPRGPLLELLLNKAESIILEREGTPVGFSVLRRFGRGLVVGPVVAADADAARALTAHWLHEHRGQFLRVDVAGDAELGGWLDSIGLPRVSVVVKMARGQQPLPAGPSRLFALVNQALG